MPPGELNQMLRKSKDRNGGHQVEGFSATQLNINLNAPSWRESHKIKLLVWKYNLSPEN